MIVLDLDVLDELGEHEKLGSPLAMEAQPEQEETKPPTIASNGFYGQKPAPAVAPQQTRLASRPSAPTHSSHGHVYPIESLSPYQHRWTIKARVTTKSDIRTWHNKNGEGKLFSVNLMDESGEIKATGFQDQCDAFYDIFTEGTVYYISSPCRVQLAKKQFTNLNNDYELSFERDTVIEKVCLCPYISRLAYTDPFLQAEEQSDVPRMRFNFTTIGNLQSVETGAVVDTIGILKDVSETTQIISKTTSKPYEKRELTLVDNSNFSVRLTIWGNTATTFDTPVESVVAFKGVKVSDFGGRSLSLLSSGTLSVDPDIDEAHQLKGWYDAQGRTNTFSTHATMGAMGGAGAGGRNDPPKTILQVKDENLGMSEQADYFTARATISYINQNNFAYPACLSERCNRKVVEHEPGAWRCENCEKSHPHPEYRYVMTVNVVDHTGQMYLSCFDEVGRVVIGMSADDLTQLKNEERDVEVFQRATYQTFTFRCKAKMDTYQDQQR